MVLREMDGIRSEFLKSRRDVKFGNKIDKDGLLFNKERVGRGAFSDKREKNRCIVNTSLSTQFVKYVSDASTQARCCLGLMPGYHQVLFLPHPAHRRYIRQLRSPQFYLHFGKYLTI